MTKILITLLFVTSCSTYVRTQSTKMLSPESQGGLGKGQVELRFEAQKRDELEFGNDTTNNAVDRADTVYALSPAGEIGFFNIVDFYVNVHTQSPSVIGLKTQLLGKGREEAKKGNFSASVIVGYGHAARESTSSTDEFIFNNDVKEVELETQHEEVGLIFGYRWFDKFLHYANIIYQHQTLEGKVTDNSGNLNKTPFMYEQDGMIYSTGFIHYFAKAYWKVDYTNFTSDWTKTHKQTVNSLSAALGFTW